MPAPLIATRTARPTHAPRGTPAPRRCPGAGSPGRSVTSRVPLVPLVGFHSRWIMKRAIARPVAIAGPSTKRGLPPANARPSRREDFRARVQSAGADASSLRSVEALANVSVARPSAPSGVAGHQPAVARRGASTRTNARVLGMPAAVLLAVSGGAAHAAGFPPQAWSAAPWLALVPLLVACAALSPRRAAVAGMCWTASAAVSASRGSCRACCRATSASPGVPSWLATLADRRRPARRVRERLSPPGSPGWCAGARRIRCCWPAAGWPASSRARTVISAARGRWRRTRSCAGRR